MTKLTALKITKGKLKPGRHPAGEGLYLQVTQGGARTWVFRFNSPAHRKPNGHGKAREMGLGSAALDATGTPAKGLAEARAEAAEQRRLVRAGVDPIDERERRAAAARLDAAKAMTFGQCADAFVAAHEPSWRNAKHAQQWRNTLATYVAPVIGPLPVQSVDRGLVLKIIEPLWHTKPETASRLRGRIEAVLDWAIARGHREGPNPAVWKGGLAKLLPRRSKVRAVRHQPALDYRALPAFMGDLRALGGTAAACLEFLILTAARSGEARGARWPEIDFDAKTWTVPADRIKAGRQHRVPLTPAAIAVLKRMAPLRDAKHGDFVFVGGRIGKPLSDTALSAAIARTGRSGITIHGFRSTFRDWCGEQTAFPRELAEAALSHTIGDATERAYARGDLFQRRAKLMGAWADYGSSPPRERGAVVSIAAAAR